MLAGRGVGLDEVERFLNPTLRELMPDPSTLTGMDALVERLAEAIGKGERIALFGDYDVDGACSCALMTRYLRHFGSEPEVYIPDRIFEGYGPNIGAIDRLIDGGATLILTLDCGTSSLAPIAHAREVFPLYLPLLPRGTPADLDTWCEQTGLTVALDRAAALLSRTA